MKDTMTCAAYERMESDALGERAVPATALYGANTVRGKENFPFKGAGFGDVATFVRAFAAIKKASALANMDLGAMDRERAEAIAGNHVSISQAVQEGLLEINHYENIICTRLFDSFRLLTTGATIFAKRCIDGIEANRERCQANLMNSFALATVLVPNLGYAAVSKLVKESLVAKRTFLDLAEGCGLISKADAMDAVKKAVHGN